MTPDALIVAQARSVRLCRTLMVCLGFTLTLDTAFAQNERTSFDIPAQALSAALETFSATSGYQILMADAGSGGLQSNPVKGLLSPRDALLQMVWGTGLEVRFTAAQAAIVIREARSQHLSASAPPRREQERYEAVLQNDVMSALCRDEATRPGRYRTALDLWVTASGRIDRAELLSSTGDAVRDKRIVAALHALASAPPPAGLNQPTTLLFLPKMSDPARLCEAVSPSMQRATAR